MQTCTRVYAFHGLSIGCSGGEAIAAALHARLGRLPEDGQGTCDLTFEYQAVAEGAVHPLERPAGPARPVYDSPMGEVLYSDEDGQLFIGCSDRVRVVCDPGRGRTRVSLVEPVGEQLWLATHPLFTLPLIEGLKRRGMFNLHAGCVSVGGKGLLLPGGSGSGKSTLALALLRAGFGFLGDDMVFLARGAGGLRALAFPEAVDLTDGTIRLFPELGDLLDAPRLPGCPKRQVRVDERYGAEIVWECRPAALVFPRFTGAERSALAPMDRGRALLELAPDILLTDARSAQAHLDALAELTATCDCYRLETGRDLDDLAARLRPLVEEHP